MKTDENTLYFRTSYMHPKNLSITDFTYNLPEERIAKYPLPGRDLSKLLIYKDGQISEDIYRNLAQHIPPNSLLVFNNTKVIPARIFFKNATGAKIEIFCLAPAPLPSPKGETKALETGDMASAMSQTGSARWNCLIGRANKWKEKQITLTVNDFTLTAEIVSRTADSFVVEFTWQPAHYTFAEILDKIGMMPIPPYLRRDAGEIDQHRYQTVYALQKGSVAAPTAGLHFTPQVLEALKNNGVQSTYVTLHVGAGTFKPVKAEKMEYHEMHAEMIDVDVVTINSLIQSLNQNIIAVGTTSLRTIESLFWMGLKAQQNPGAALHQLEIKQWDPYNLHCEHYSKEHTVETLQALLNWMHKNELNRLLCKTQIMIAPGYKLRVADALITNFHQPASTLLLLVAAVIGNDNTEWKRIYEYALANRFRFLSYGDGSLLWAKTDSITKI
jgi:S-adenosylmethionine:tRNA ribosyltransferase-isomerase